MANKPLIKGDEVRHGKFIHLEAISKELIAAASDKILSEKLLFKINSGREPVFPQSAKDVMESFATQGEMALALCLNTDQACIGVCRLGNLAWQARSAQFFIGMVNEAYLTSEMLVDAIQTTLQFVYWEANLNRIQVQCVADNTLLREALEAVGFTNEGHLRQEAYRNGQYLDISVYSILQREWSS